MVLIVTIDAGKRPYQHKTSYPGWCIKKSYNKEDDDNAIQKVTTFTTTTVPIIMIIMI